VSPRKWPRRIEDILDAISEIQVFVRGQSREDFCRDTKTLKAVMADLAVIGEAAGHIPDDVITSHPEIPWALMKAMRNRIVHVYFDVDPNIVWNTLQQDLPVLVETLRKLLKEADSPGDS
jgi:uncharacterized protein with HEPN domain